MPALKYVPGYNLPGAEARKCDFKGNRPFVANLTRPYFASFARLASRKQLSVQDLSHVVMNDNEEKHVEV